MSLPDSAVFAAFENVGGDGKERQLTLQWAMDLKPQVAQAITERLSSNLSRVGITQSEWLRLGGRQRVMKGDRIQGPVAAPASAPQPVPLESSVDKPATDTKRVPRS